MNNIDNIIMSSLTPVFEGFESNSFPETFISYKEPIAIAFELEQTNRDLQIITSEFESLQRSISNLELLYSCLESINSQGGLNSNNAILVNQILNNITGELSPKLALGIKMYIAPAMESVIAGNLNKTHVLMEKITDTIKAFGSSVWNAVKEFFKKFINWIMETIHGKGGALVRLADALDKKIKTLTDIKDDVTEINVKMFVKYLLSPKNGTMQPVAQMQNIIDNDEILISLIKSINGLLLNPSDDFTTSYNSIGISSKMNKLKPVGNNELIVHNGDVVSYALVEQEEKRDYMEKPISKNNLSTIAEYIKKLANNYDSNLSNLKRSVESSDNALNALESQRNKILPAQYEYIKGVFNQIKELYVLSKNQSVLSEQVMKAAYGYAGKHVSCYKTN